MGCSNAIRILLFSRTRKFRFIIIIIIINLVFCPNPVQQDENLIFTVQERNIYIIINLIYEINNWLSNVHVDRSDNGNKKIQLKMDKRKINLQIISRIIKKENDQTKLTKILK